MPGFDQVRPGEGIVGGASQFGAHSACEEAPNLSRNATRQKLQCASLTTEPPAAEEYALHWRRELRRKRVY